MGLKNPVFCGTATTYPPFSHYPQRKKKEPKKKERAAAVFLGPVLHF
jgi:hypothetical protein